MEMLKPLVDSDEVIPGIYVRHNGVFYEVLMTVTWHETEDDAKKLVIYQDRRSGERYSESMDYFLSVVDTTRVSNVPRFMYMCQVPK